MCATVTMASFFSSDNNLCVVDTLFTEAIKLLDRPQEQIINVYRAKLTGYNVKTSDLAYYLIVAPRVRVPASARNLFVLLYNRTRLKDPPFDFSALRDFESFLKLPKDAPSIFCYFATNWTLKIPKGPSFYLFRNCAFFSKYSFRPKIRCFYKTRVLTIL